MKIYSAICSFSLFFAFNKHQQFSPQQLHTCGV